MTPKSRLHHLDYRLAKIPAIKTLPSALVDGTCDSSKSRESGKPTTSLLSFFNLNLKTIICPCEPTGLAQRPKCPHAFIPQRWGAPGFQLFPTLISPSKVSVHARTLKPTKTCYINCYRNLNDPDHQQQGSADVNFGLSVEEVSSSSPPSSDPVGVLKQSIKKHCYSIW
ncbi:hypothetical protein AVEN_176263-1 [Araneus ventricosus]|uniref:Uncharacterized protein n=1 Tax=Araneus ventricosus TaxID=182803 RepID=A0A4Y2U2W9_ARAVE|nr:hypothetical protein AVEN_176263-1 [Araneus ventricosus]